jgi:hypothetical protein
VAISRSAVPVAEALHHAVALRLVEAAVQRLGPVAAHRERLVQLVHLVAGAAEEDRRGGRLKVQHAGQRLQLVRARHHVRRLPHERRLQLGRAHGHAHRVAHVARGELGDAGREGGGEERRLPPLGGLGEDRLDVLDEPHVQHLVRLVQHHVADGGEVQRAAADVVQDAPRRADDDVDAAAQLAELAVDGLAAVHGQHADAALGAVAVRRLGHLHGQLARGRQHERLHPAQIRVDALHQREREGGGLAGAGGGLPQHVPSGEEGGDRLHLDGCGLLVS